MSKGKDVFEQLAAIRSQVGTDAEFRKYQQALRDIIEWTLSRTVQA